MLTTSSKPAVLLRCEPDTLPPRQATGTPCAATASGQEVPAGHAEATTSTRPV